MFAMREVYSALPDDRPITSLCVVEDATRCPMNFTAISKSHDQDVDADLYKDGFFSRRITRYLCHSKTEGFLGYVLEKLTVVSDKDSVPQGFSPLIVTHDTNQRTFKKKQICYKAQSRNMAQQFITDIIVLSNSKMAPPGFTLAGELNGVLICYKAVETSNSPINLPQATNTSLPYNVSPHGASDPRRSSAYPALDRPSRPAPAPPGGRYSVPQFNNSPQLPHRPQGTPSDTYDVVSSALYAVPFEMNKKYVKLSDGSKDVLPTVQRKSSKEIENQYQYNFSMEQDILQRQT